MTPYGSAGQRVRTNWRRGQDDLLAMMVSWQFGTNNVASWQMISVSFAHDWLGRIGCQAGHFTRPDDGFRSLTQCHQLP